MPRLRFRDTDDGPEPDHGAIPFPESHADPDSTADEQPPADGAADAADCTSEVLDAFDSVSRRMKDLARALGCLGFFDDDDRPRAA
jgi:hypothetical protein